MEVGRRGFLRSMFGALTVAAAAPLLNLVPSSVQTAAAAPAPPAPRKTVSVMRNTPLHESDHRIDSYRMIGHPSNARLHAFKADILAHAVPAELLGKSRRCL